MSTNDGATAAKTPRNVANMRCIARNLEDPEAPSYGGS
jgi:hypothetical protein